jgi:hypothetical protein
MITKGTTHNNGARLARYMTTGKEGEKAELWQLSGFAANDIREAFRSVHVMAEATRCEQPFFHVQVRNPESEEITRAQWLRVADRIEAKLGLTNQPRAIAFHIDRTTGHEHMHVAWSRIDDETLTARPLPFFKERLKEVSRELEIALGLTRVTSERDGPVRAPRRNEFEQARRLGVNLEEVRHSIRECFDLSDNGQAFAAALAHHGFTLSAGARRDFIVIDPEGGLHALGKRILGISAAQIRERLVDLDRERLPAVEEARAQKRAQKRIREKDAPAPIRDADREEIAWQDALAKAAIEKEKIERRFVEPAADKEMPGGREKKEGNEVRRPPNNVKGIAAQIWSAYNNSPNAKGFAAELDQHNILLAAVTKDEAERSYRQAAFARAVGNRAPVYREGEIVAVAEPGLLFRREGQVTERPRVFRLNKYTTGQNRVRIEESLELLDRKQLEGLDATKEKLAARSSERGARWESIRSDNARRIDRFAPTRAKSSSKDRLKGADGLARMAEGTIGKTLDFVGTAIESLFAPQTTPEQEREAAKASRERAAEADRSADKEADKVDFSRYLAAREEARRQEEQAREGDRQRQRDERERG